MKLGILYIVIALALLFLGFDMITEWLRWPLIAFLAYMGYRRVRKAVKVKHGQKSESGK